MNTKPLDFTQACNDYCQQQMNESSFMNNAYFRQLEQGRMPLEHFRSSQRQFYFAVLFFSRPLSALLARLPLPHQRLHLLENVLEEHGNFRQQSFHEASFRAFLDSIGANSTELQQLQLHPSLRAFNSILSSACMLDEVEVGVSCLGAIEYAFAEISAHIGHCVVENNWVQEDLLVHYKLHAEIDQQHAADLFGIVADNWDDPEKNYLIRQGIELGLYAFEQLYSSLTYAKNLERPM